MIVFCEDCGAKNSINPEGFDSMQVHIKCRRCHENIRIDGSPRSRTAGKSDQTQVFKSRMMVKYQNIMIHINEDRKKISMGRLKKNDIAIVKDHVSRFHTTIKYESGKYVLTDQSKNGTYVLIQGRQGIFVKKKTLLLSNSGIIGLGGVVTNESSEAIHFLIKV
jgi:pSer/pThr/pTyr-binding forkhead associated (FHA) protein